MRGTYNLEESLERADEDPPMSFRHALIQAKILEGQHFLTMGERVSYGKIFLVFRPKHGVTVVKLVERLDHMIQQTFIVVAVA